MNKYTIIADSSCDLTDKMKKIIGAADTIPFYINIKGVTLVDDDTLDLPLFVSNMNSCTEKMTTACASPLLWKEAMLKAGSFFAITLSSKLSGSHASALAGLQLAKEENPDIEGYVFDSLSATAGEVLAAYKLHEFIESGLSFDEIVATMNDFLANMKTVFVLDDVSNLVRNGRMNKVVGTLVTIIGIRPLLAAEEGEIVYLDKVRGIKNIPTKLLDTVEKCGRVIDGDELVITHCNNLPLATQLAKQAKERFKFGKCSIVATRGLSSFYTGDKGVVMSF
ncbi:MAG: DegV family protein [Oscillospiraceae bacterium]|jgi:DegV family protein with EDD domain|nr:DegV family protein [Oscillospiraceae bacterium]